MNKRFTTWVIFLHVLVIFLVITNVCLLIWPVSLAGAGVVRTTSKLDQLENLIDEKYIGDPDLTLLEDAASAAMGAATGDRWAYYIPADQYKAHQEMMANAYVGIGVTILMDPEITDGFYIQQVDPNGPAREAGLLPGDILYSISGKPTKDMRSEDARNLIRGEEGTTVEVTVLRGEEELPFTVERRTIETVVASGRMVAEDIGLVTIANFDDRCSQEAIAAIEELKAQGAEKILFDVRNNPGGYAHELVKLLDYLLPEGDLFRTEDYEGNQQVDTSDANFLDMPMAVLVNGDSYSAAEFFAAALRDYEAGLIIGEKTTGKGHFQQTYKLQDGSAVNISVGKYSTPKGVNLDGIGLVPDVEVPVDEETARAIAGRVLEDTEDPQLQAAIKALEAEN